MGVAGHVASYYAASANAAPALAPLHGETRAGVCVIGGGYTGLSTALHLAGRGVDVVLLEAERIGWGASGRNGGQAIAGLACDQSVIEAQLGREASRRVWDMTLEAIRLIGQRRARFGIDCDWRDGYLGLAVNERKARELRVWHEQMQRDYGYQTTWISPRASSTPATRRAFAPPKPDLAEDCACIRFPIATRSTHSRAQKAW